jgi:uncharacterized membrane protein YidH (DUF202 family)
MGADRGGDCGIRVCDRKVFDCDAAVDTLSGHAVRTAGLSVWMGSGSIMAGVLLVVAGLVRYRKTRTQLDAGTFEPAGFVVDLITMLTVVFGLVLAAYLIYTEKILG